MKSGCPDCGGIHFGQFSCPYSKYETAQLNPTCKHENFISHVDVNRITNQSVGDGILVYALDLRVNCKDCGQPLQFVGLPNGMSFYRPTSSLDGQEARFPMVIPGEQIPVGLAGFSVTQEVFNEQEATKQ